MTMMHLHFSGKIQKVEHRQAGEKKLVEVSLCRKEKGRGEGAEDTYTWIRVTCWDVKDFQSQRLLKGNLISGHGDFKLRSFESGGVKRQSAEVRCSSFDIEVEEMAGAERAPSPAPVAPRPTKPDHAAAAAGDDDSSPPF